MKKKPTIPFNSQKEIQSLKDNYKRLEERVERFVGGYDRCLNAQKNNQEKFEEIAATLEHEHIMISNAAERINQHLRIDIDLSPKFKVGDKVTLKGGFACFEIQTITKVISERSDHHYDTNHHCFLPEHILEPVSNSFEEEANDFQTLRNLAQKYGLILSFPKQAK